MSGSKEKAVKAASTSCDITRRPTISIKDQITDLHIAIGKRLSLATTTDSQHPFFSAFSGRLDDLIANAMDANATQFKLKFFYSALEGATLCTNIKTSCTLIELEDNGDGFKVDIPPNTFVRFKSLTLPRKGEGKIGGMGKALVWLQEQGVEIWVKNLADKPGEKGCVIRLQWVGIESACSAAPFILGDAHTGTIWQRREREKLAKEAAARASAITNSSVSLDWVAIDMQSPPLPHTGIAILAHAAATLFTPSPIRSISQPSAGSHAPKTTYGATAPTADLEAAAASEGWALV